MSDDYAWKNQPLAMLKSANRRTSQAPGHAPDWQALTGDGAGSGAPGLGWRHAAGYWIDEHIIASRRAQAAFLLLLCLLLCTVFGAAYAEALQSAAAGLGGGGGGGSSAVEHAGDFVQGMWSAWLIMSDPGTHASVAPNALAPRLTAMFVAWVGIVFFAALTGFVVDAVTTKMVVLRKGGGAVVEEGHTLMLGWNVAFSTVIAMELAEANASEGGGQTLVVLADVDKQGMEREFAHRVPKAAMQGTRVIFRRGSPLLAADLLGVSCHTARAIILLADTGAGGAGGDGGGGGGGEEEDGDDPCEAGLGGGVAVADKADAATLRSVLVLSGLASEPRTALRGHVVAQLLDVDNIPLLRMVAGADLRLETLCSHDVIGRLMLMSARAPGLARVYAEILGFDGDEFYNACWGAELAGLAFGDLAERFPDATPIGIIRRHAADAADAPGAAPDASGGGDDKEAPEATGAKVMLNPDPAEILLVDDELICIAEDDDTYRPVTPGTGANPAVPADPRGPPAYTPPTPGAETILITGWRRDIRDMLTQLNSLVAAGSVAHILAQTPIAERQRELAASGLFPDAMLRNLKIVHHTGNSANRRVLMKLPGFAGEGGASSSNFTSIMVLVDKQSEADVVRSDSNTLATLLLLRDIQKADVTLGFNDYEMLIGVGAGVSLLQCDDLSEGGMAQAHAQSPKGKARRRTKADKQRRASAQRTSALPSGAHRPRRTSQQMQLLVPCICEILDPSTQKTVATSPAVATASDFVQSNKMISQILAMVGENTAVKTILDELLGSRGSDLCVVPAVRYARCGAGGEDERVSYMTLAKRAQRFREVLCGYQDGTATVMNPRDKHAAKHWRGVSMVVLRCLPAPRAIAEGEAAAVAAATVAAEAAAQQPTTLLAFDPQVNKRMLALEGKLDTVADCMRELRGVSGYL